MSNQETNEKIVAEIFELAKKIKLEGNASHDTIFVSYVNNTPKGTMLAKIRNFFAGCCCNVPLILNENCKLDKEFTESVIMIAGKILTEKVHGKTDVHKN